MKNDVCVMFGMDDAPDNLTEKILKTAERYYLEHGVRFFIFGYTGNFDKCALKAFNMLKEKYPDVGGNMQMIFEPPIEEFPREFPILEVQNEFIREAKTFICYVKRPYNTRTLLRITQGIHDYDQRIITNLGRR
ncbi:MAG: hypothetical protein IJD63_03045 [Oscillospiraceae bacterium]|nr:hypothetical protein [Oscillospiraceae bacterium]